MYGKHFESTYEGSLYGAGLAVFAVWGWVIAHTKKSRVELNPRKLADTLGGEVKDIEKAVEFLMKPDSASRHKDCEGRRLVQEGQFQYFVPSWEAYQAIRNEEDRREYNKQKQREYRAAKKLRKDYPQRATGGASEREAVKREQREAEAKAAAQVTGTYQDGAD